MGELRIESIREAIQKNRARWEAKDNPILQLPTEEQRRRLGVIRDDRDLLKLRQQAKPDLTEVLTQHAVTRLVAIADLDPSQMREQLRVLLEFRKTIAQFKHFGPLIPCWCWLTEVDWRNRCGINAVTPIRDQGDCGSCVSFGSIGTLESMIIIEHAMRTDLSEAELLFCGGGSCAGWWPSNAIDYVTKRGVSQEECFRYRDHDMACETCCRRAAEAISIRNSISVFDVDQRKDHLYWVGPMIGCFAVYDDFFAYGSGVYSHVTGGLASYHCVEIIGYDDNEQCWLCKNSWGSYWGDQGFFRIGYGECEIDSSFPFWGVSGTKWFA